MTPQSSILAGKILWTEEHGGLHSTCSQRVRPTEQSTLSSSSFQLNREERSIFNLGVPTMCEYCAKS